MPAVLGRNFELGGRGERFWLVFLSVCLSELTFLVNVKIVPLYSSVKLLSDCLQNCPNLWKTNKQSVSLREEVREDLMNLLFIHTPIDCFKVNSINTDNGMLRFVRQEILIDDERVL